MSHADPSLAARFEAAAASAQDLSVRPSNANLLKLYALYKQGSAGNNSAAKPGLSDLVGRAKWEAWQQLSGLAQVDAQQQYIDLLASLT